MPRTIFLAHVESLLKSPCDAETFSKPLLLFSLLLGEKSRPATVTPFILLVVVGRSAHSSLYRLP